MTTEISPTNNPSPTSHIVAEGHGDSYDTTFNDEPARIGSIEPNVTIAEYTVHSPKVLYATSGAVGINDRNHNTGTFFTIPIGNVHLETGVSGLRYISRKVSPEVTEETIKQLTYLRENGIGDDTWFSLPRSEQFARLWSVVGDTGMQEIILPNEKPAYIKRELDNPSGSHYDRAYLHTLQHYEEIGFLQPGDTIMDISSGSAGISLALIGTLLGYKVGITVPEELPANRLYPILAFGAVAINAGTGYVPRAAQVQVAQIQGYRGAEGWVETRPSDRSGRSILFQFEGKQRICYLNHSENELSPRAFATIADEIVSQQPGLTHLVLAEGNWTTITGIARRIRQLKPDTRIISYQGEHDGGITENYGTTVPDVALRFFDDSLVDERIVVTNDQRNTMRETAPELGNSTLMGLYVDQQITNTNQNSVVVSLAYDSSSKYKLA